jgi:branched-chain amino acid transport system ATP-binding protein
MRRKGSPVCLPHAAPVPVAEALLEVRGLAKRFGGVVATDNVDLDVARGEVHALIGPNGAGKTTLVHQLSGALAPDAGTLQFDGDDLGACSLHERVRRGLARSYQLTSIFRGFTALDNLALAVQARSGTSFSFWRPLAQEKALFDEARRIAVEVGLGARVDVLARNLAHGEQRQLEVGLALATRPKLVLLDEPTAGMGVEDAERMIAFLGTLKASVAMLLIEHDMDVVFRLADRISVLVNGKIIASGAPAKIRADSQVKRAYLGEAAA